MKGSTGTSMTTVYVTENMRKTGRSPGSVMPAHGLTRAERKKERAEIKRKNRELRERKQAEKLERSIVRPVTISDLSRALETSLTIEDICSCKEHYHLYGNGRFAVRCVDVENQIIDIKDRRGAFLRYRIVR